MSEKDYRQRQFDKLKRAQRVLEKQKRIRENKRPLRGQGIERERYDSKD